MKPAAMMTLTKMVEYMGLSLCVSDQLPATVGGFLDPSEEPLFIAVNGNLPEYEQAFSLAHEMAHYVLHHRNDYFRKRLPWFLKHQWKIPVLQRLSKRIRFYAAVVMNRECQADLYAFCALVKIGAVEEIRAILEKHPEKAPLFYWTIAGCVLDRAKLFE